MRKRFILALLAATVTAMPAQADSFSVSFSSGDYRHDGWKHNGHGWKHGHHKHHWKKHSHHRDHYWFPRPVYYQPTQHVIYYQQPVEQVIFAGNAPGFQNSYGQYCREYQALVLVGGQKQPGYGTACYQPDGSWKVVNN